MDNYFIVFNDNKYFQFNFNVINNKLNFDINKLFYIDFYININFFFYIHFNFINNNISVMKKPTYTPHLSVYTWASQFVYGKKVLDIGCGDGYGLVIVSMFTKEVLGYDNSPRAIQIASSQRYLCPAKIEEFDLEKKFITEDFDIALAFEVLEHIDNPKEVMKRFHEMGKTVIFSVPHAYPHKLHKTDYYSREDVEKLTEGFSVHWFYLSGTNIVEDVPKKIDRYIGIATPK